MTDDVIILTDNGSHEVDVLYKRACVLLSIDWEEACFIFGDTKQKRADMWPMLEKRLLKIREEYGPSSMAPPAPLISKRRQAIMAQKARNKK